MCVLSVALRVVRYSLVPLFSSIDMSNKSACTRLNLVSGVLCAGTKEETGGVETSSVPFPFAEDVHELRKQIRSLEEKNAVYMQQNLDLEEELRRTSSVKVQLNSHKQRV